MDSNFRFRARKGFPKLLAGRPAFQQMREEFDPDSSIFFIDKRVAVD